jgi:hypothetical protein
MTWKPIATAVEGTVFWAAEFRKNELYGHLFMTQLVDGELHWEMPYFSPSNDTHEIKFRSKSGRFNPTHWRELDTEWLLLDPDNPEKYLWDGTL